MLHRRVCDLLTTELLQLN